MLSGKDAGCVVVEMVTKMSVSIGCMMVGCSGVVWTSDCAIEN